MKDFSDIGFLIQQLVSGSEDAWSYFLKHFGRLIYHCINKIMNHNFSREDREDCFQEILRVLVDKDCKRLKQIRSYKKRSFCSWLGKLTTLRTYNFIRERKKSYPFLDEVLSVSPDSITLPDDKILRSQIKDIINQRLNDQERLVILYYLDGLTLEEIADLMGLKLGTVFNIKKKGIDDLKDFTGQD